MPKGEGNRGGRRETREKGRSDYEDVKIEVTKRKKVY